MFDGNLNPNELSDDQLTKITFALFDAFFDRFFDGISPRDELNDLLNKSKTKGRAIRRVSTLNSK